MNMPENNEVHDVKGLQPRSITLAKKMDSAFGDGITGFYSAIWADREGGISKKDKHLLVFAIACSSSKTDSAIKILPRLKKFGASAQEIKDVLMLVAWTSGMQNFTDISPDVLREMEKLDF